MCIIIKKMHGSTDSKRGNLRQILKVFPFLFGEISLVFTAFCDQRFREVFKNHKNYETFS